MSATLLDHSTPRARKTHQCTCCHADIDAGTEYVRQRIVDSHELWVFKAHPDCYSTLMDYCSYHAIDSDDPMPDWGEVQQWVAEGNMEPTDAGS